jgi:deazaflavin-dependent oxidoreductase (nitroreductase family)
MGLQQQLGYAIPDRNILHRATARLMSTRPGAWLGYHTVPALDRLTLRLTDGSSTISQWFAGVPPIWLTSIGARSGQPRETPLYGIPVREHIALIGTGFGQKPTPAWAHNLNKNPRAAVRFGDREAEVDARHADREEEDLVWETGRSIYSGFREYRRRLERDVYIYVLEPT